MLQPLERSRIRLFLGAPDGFRQLDTRLESVLGNISDEGEILVRECLATLVSIETLIQASLATAGLKSVDEIHFFAAGSQLNQQRKAGRQYVARLSILLGVPVYGDCFGTSGYPGDDFSGNGLGARYGGGFYGVG